MSTPTATAPIVDENVGDQASTQASAETIAERPAIEAEMLIEEISIDGMCGVY